MPEFIKFSYFNYNFNISLSFLSFFFLKISYFIINLLFLCTQVFECYPKMVKFSIKSYIIIYFNSWGKKDKNF